MLVKTENEAWKSVPEFEGYEASDLGRLRSYWLRDGKRRHGGIRKWREEPILVGGYVWPKGYLFARLSRVDGRPKWKAIHAIVLETFVGPCPEGMECCHDPDPDPSNNRLSNIRWDTREANQLDVMRGGRHRQMKLNEDDVRAIWARLLDGESGKLIAADMRIGYPTISMIRTGRQWTHVTKDLPGFPMTPLRPMFR